MTDNKEKYKTWVEQQNSCIFAKPWWLDAVSKSNEKQEWDVVLFEKQNKIVAAWPYVFNRSKKEIEMPILTQKLGPVFFYPNNLSHYKKIKLEKQAMFTMLEQLPSYASFHQHFDYKITNWLPLYWKGYTQSTRYTYIINSANQLDELYNNFESDTQRIIRKSQNILKIREIDSIEDFYLINKKTYERQRTKIGYSLETLMNIDEACVEHNSRRMLAAFDEEGNMHGALYLVFDNECVYYLMGGIDPNYKSSGSMSLLLFEAIKFAHETNRKFDFEGSMMESIEGFFRSFGAIQTPYFSISKTNSKLQRIKRLIGEIIR